jgi:hypothetical protein
MLVEATPLKPWFLSEIPGFAAGPDRELDRFFPEDPAIELLPPPTLDEVAIAVNSRVSQVGGAAWSAGWLPMVTVTTRWPKDVGMVDLSWAFRNRDSGVLDMIETRQLKYMQLGTHPGQMWHVSEPGKMLRVSSYRAVPGSVCVVSATFWSADRTRSVSRECYCLVQACARDTDGDGNCPLHPKGCP